MLNTETYEPDEKPEDMENRNRESKLELSSTCTVKSHSHHQMERPKWMLSVLSWSHTQTMCGECG